MMDKPLPVSVIIPAKDAGESLGAAIDSIRMQTYPNIEEVIVAAADDDSATAAREGGARVVDNPGGSTPSGLNIAIGASTGQVLVRCDARSFLPADYVARAIETMTRTGADVVGGMQIPVGVSFWERSIAAAMSSAIGAGDARYRLGGHEGPVETVYLGVFKRSALERVGGFDERFVRTQDYELNHRIIESGGVVWFDPELRVEYRPRGSLSALARQYLDYGRSKRMFGRKHPGSLKWRQLAAPGIVVALVTSLAASAIWPITLAVPSLYLASLVAAGVAAVPKAGVSAMGTPLALLTMHMTWGLGFLMR